ncbi:MULTISPECIES: hypothetical protein [unclassified Acidovorax]|uniref:hypothetical protein n=1 Tax=unclassified Acidovorax TaxID=2684926 RepID=UPI0006F3169B|nr:MULTISPECIES: hypothetical protein [unclassified Acidovorax]KRB28801.1 hypothetical protein ASD94_07640 [Acidovorax sp. Root70]
MAKPPPEVAAAMWIAIARNGLEQSTLSPMDNWHQTLSDRYGDTPEMRQRMLRAGADVKARACTLVLNRIRDGVHKEQGKTTIQWSFRARGRPQCFDALLAAVRHALSTEGLATKTGHTPHTTISYWAPTRLGPTQMNPIAWTIDEILLVVGRNDESYSNRYSYETIGRWPLQPAPPDPSSTQLPLF